jgi:hypothetical protein
MICSTSAGKIKGDLSLIGVRLRSRKLDAFSKVFCVPKQTAKKIVMQRIISDVKRRERNGHFASTFCARLAKAAA